MTRNVLKSYVPLVIAFCTLRIDCRCHRKYVKDLAVW